MMELSLAEAEARFAEVVVAAAAGERVVITKDGEPLVTVSLARAKPGMDFEKAAAARRALGLDGLTVNLPPDFDDPAFSRRVLGLEE